jgi:putative ABC transport system substrate-binding protein
MMHLGALPLALVLFVSLVPNDAQSAETMPRVDLGFLNEPEASPFRDAFVRGLRDLGYAPGQNIIVDVHRWTTERQLQQVLSEFVRLKTNVIFVGPPFAATAAKQATKDIPIVCGSCGDPVENGLAASLARPGGNVTGLASCRPSSSESAWSC